LKRVEIPLPPLEKQREIVEMLDRAVKEVGRMRSQIATKRDLALMLRQSLLSEAFSPGKEMASK
jgi:restriction endonuclease S subunit